jgi:hypothetical protein
MPGFTRRNVLKSGAALAGGGVLTALSPQIVRGVTDLLILGQQAPNLSGTQTVAQFPAGAGPQELGIQDRKLMEPQGPNAIAALADGSLAILDTVNRRVAIVRGSKIERTISLPGAVYPTDLQEAGGHLYVLDGGGNQILEIGESNTQTIPLPAASFGRTSGLMDAGNGAIAVIEEGLSYYRVAAGRGSLAPGFPLPSGEVVEVEYEQPTQAKRKAKIELGLKDIKIKSSNFLGSVTVAGFDAAGRTYLLSSELIPGQTGNEVDLVVTRVERDGKAGDLARVPVRNRWFNPTRAVAIAPSGQAFAIYPQRTGTLLLELTWQSKLDPLAAALVLPSVASMFEARATNAITGVCRNGAIVSAGGYLHHDWNCSQANYNTCQGSQRPAFITGLGLYSSVPYDWDGFSTLSGFDADIAANKTAGNTSTVVLFCTTGVDCSGFIQRCWNINDAKVDDTGLTNWCTNIALLDPGNPPPWMNPGDMYRLPGQHARMHEFYASGNTGVYVDEAPGDPGRVSFNYYSWGQLNGYQWCIANFGC